MTVHPLRPAIHRRLGALLPHQLANGPQAHPQAEQLLLLSIRLAAERPHAVLPHVSMGYSPPKGRSPTCYSPVRHSHEAPKGLTPVRLACLIRAASVRSEPGSNSPSYIVAPHSEERKAHFSNSVLYNSSFTRFKLTSLDPYLFSYLPFPIAEKHPTASASLTAGSLKPTRSLPR